MALCNLVLDIPPKKRGFGEVAIKLGEEKYTRLS